MASSMMSGERRWVSARRGGMTVLGRVTVPKPVNLPSQRLENHGLDPNVEIVPKGTLSWGSRPPSQPNAWGSSQSPHANGTAGSSGQLNGRPSSGGSGTRPSTAGSDRSHEPSANAWGSNSRPSSASGILASNQTSMSSPRPRSAETRPGSSQLSRFAESISENSGPWGGLTTAEKLGTASSRSSEFTLSSGDFPTLGSEKNSEMLSRQGHSSHGRPGSASSATPNQKESASSPNEDGHVDAIDVKVSVNTWRRDASPYNEGGTPPGIEKWQRDPQMAQPYPNPNIPSHHFEPWHGTPIRNPPDGVWYRGGPPGAPYGPGGPPGSYPLEPFGYYHSPLPARPIPNSQGNLQIPARPVPNSQVGPRAGINTTGYNPKPGETYHPRMPDSYSVAASVIPVRHGVYPGPVPYDGYYGPPPMSFCNPNEKDNHSAGTVPHVYNRFSNQNAGPDPGNFPARPVPYFPGPAVAKEQIESEQTPDAHRGPYKVLLKQHDGWGENDSEDNNEHTTAVSMSRSERGSLQRKPMRGNEWEVDHRKHEPEDLSKSVVGEEPSSQPICNQKGCISVSPVNPPESKANAVDESLLKKPEPIASSSEGPQHIPVIKKDSALIDKIEGLNTKARISDGRTEIRPAREEKGKQLGILNVKADLSVSGSVRSTALKEKSHAGGLLNPPHKGLVDASIADGSYEPTAVGRVMSSPEETQASMDSIVGERNQSQMRGQALQGRVDHRGKGRFSSQESEEWRKKPAGKSTSVVTLARNVDAQLSMHMQDPCNFKEVPRKEESNLSDNAGTEPYVTSSVDDADYKAQRAKMKEFATQRAKQLQKEEEERTREQKAKAFAKLEELNRRKLMENQTQKLECGAVQLKQEEHLCESGSQTDNDIGVGAPGLSGCNSDAAIQASEDVITIKESMESSLNRPSEDSLNHAPKSSVGAMDQFVHLTLDASSTEFVAEKSISQFPDGGGQNQKQMGYKRKQNASNERNLPGKMAASGIITVQDNVDSCANVPSAESFVASNASTKDDHPQQQQHKKRNNRVAKNKHRTDESLSITTSPSLEPTEMSPAKAPTETKKVTPETLSAASSEKVETLRAALKAGDPQHEGLVSAGHALSQPAEEAHGRTTGHWKAQSHRRISRNAQSIRPVEKFHGNEGTIWAPVRTPINKCEPFDESSQHVNMNSGLSLGKTSHGLQSNLMKGKRAEIERYVPKPVAKELSQQENSQGALVPPVSDVEVIKSDLGSQSTKCSGQDHSAHGKAGLEVKNAEVKQHKNGKMHASWRQCSPVESSTGLQSSKERPTSSSDPSKIMHKSADLEHIPQADFPSQKEQEKYSDGWNMEPMLQEVTAPIIVKDHGGPGRVKRQQSKAPRSSGHSHSLGDRNDAEEPVDRIDNQPITFGSIEMDARSTPRNENQAKVDHSSTHWQPKSQAHSTQSRQGRRGNGGQRQFHEKESSHITPKVDKDAILQVQLHQPDAQKAGVEMNDPHHHKARREVKVANSSKEQANTLNRVPPHSTEVVADNVDTYCEEFVSTGMNRQRQHGGRFNRGQEVAYGGGRGNSVQDSNKQQMPTNVDRRKHGSHYEYQPVGSYNRPDNLFHQEEVHERSQGTSSRYRERGQNHLRRGGQFYGRNSGGSAVRMATTYGNED